MADQIELHKSIDHPYCIHTTFSDTWYSWLSMCNETVTLAGSSAHFIAVIELTA